MDTKYIWIIWRTKKGKLEKPVGLAEDELEAETILRHKRFWFREYKFTVFKYKPVQGGPHEYRL